MKVKRNCGKINYEWKGAQLWGKNSQDEDWLYESLTDQQSQEINTESPTKAVNVIKNIGTHILKEVKKVRIKRNNKQQGTQKITQNEKK